MSDEAIEASGLRVKAMLETLGSGYTQYTADKIAETAIGPYTEPGSLYRFVTHGHVPLWR